VFSQDREEYTRENTDHFWGKTGILAEFDSDNEIVSRRTEYSKTIRVNDTTNNVIIADFHYTDEKGNLKELNFTPKPKDGKLVNSTNRFYSSFDENHSIINYKNLEVKIKQQTSFQFNSDKIEYSKSVEPTYINNVVQYHNVYPNADALYEISSIGIEHKLRINESTFFDKPTDGDYFTYSEEISIPSSARITNLKGNNIQYNQVLNEDLIILLNDSSKLYIPQPAIWDEMYEQNKVTKENIKHYKKIRFKLSRNKESIKFEMQIPKNWIQENNNYPIYIDPSAFVDGPIHVNDYQYPFRTNVNKRQMNILVLNSLMPQSGNITKIRFLQTSPNSYINNNTKIRMKHTSQNSINSSSFSSFTGSYLYNGNFNLTGTNGYKDLVLDNSFAYNDSQHLLIEIKFHNISSLINPNDVSGVHSVNVGYNAAVRGFCNCSGTPSSYNNFGPEVPYMILTITSNNSSSVDLQALNSTVTPNSGSVGDQIEIETDITLVSGTSCGSSEIEYYISNDQYLSNDDIYIDNDYVSSLSPQGDDSHESDVSTIPNLSPGNYYILIKVDADEEIIESNENNNIVAIPFTVTSGNSSSPDLTYVSSYNNLNNSGTIFSGSFKIKNIGTADANSTSKVRLYLTTDGTLGNSDDIYVGYKNISSLNDGSSSTKSFSYNLANVTSNVGTYRLGYIIDADEDVSESNENNNTFIWNSPTYVVSGCSPPVANFTNYNSEIAIGQPTFFTNQSSNGTNYTWTISGGTPSTVNNYNSGGITFNSPGTKSVQLHVSNACGNDYETKYYKVKPNYSAGYTPIPEKEAIGNNTQSSGGDPVNMATGAYTWGQKDMTVNGINGSFPLIRLYNSRINQEGLLGYNWRLNYNIELKFLTDECQVLNGDGSTTHFVHYSDDTFLPKYRGVTDSLYKSGSYYILERINGDKLTFNPSGKIIHLKNRNNNTINFSYTSGKMSQITFPGGRYFQFTYTGNYISQVTDGTRTVKYHYSNGNMDYAVNVLGDTTFYECAVPTNHQITKVTDPNGNTVIENTYSGGKVVAQKDGNGNDFYFSYDNPVLGATKITNELGHQQTHYHDSDFRLIKLVDELGYFREFEYDLLNNISKVTDELGNSVTNVFDDKGNLITTTNPLNQVDSFAYSNLNILTLSKNRDNYTTTFTQDALGNLTQTVFPNGATINNSFLPTGQIDSVINAHNGYTKYTYYTNGDIQSISTPLGTSYLEYNSYGFVNKITDRNGNISQFVTDEMGHILQVIDAQQDTVFNTYDKNGNLIEIINRMGDTTTFVYNIKNDLAKVINSEGDSTVLIYDAIDRLVTIIDANGNSTHRTYTQRGDLASIQNTLGTSYFTYDPRRLPKTTEDASGNISRQSYDILGRLDSIINPDNTFKIFTHNARGLQTSMQDELGRKTDYFYNSVNQLISVKDALGGQVHIDYDLLGNVISHKDAKQNETLYKYHPLKNQLDSIIHPTGLADVFTYDNEDNLLTHKDRNNLIAAYSYNNIYENIGVSYSNGNNYLFQRDKNGRVYEAIVNGLSTHTYYNSLGWITKTIDQNNLELQYLYDKVGNKTGVVYPQGDTLTTVYNAVNLPTSVTDWLGNSQSYDYEPTGLLKEIINSNGTSTEIEYDALNRIDKYINLGLGNDTISRHKIEYDPVGNIINRIVKTPLKPAFKNTTRTTNYGVDDRITSSSLGSYTYDNNGARTSFTSPTDSIHYNFSENSLLASYTINNNTTQNSFNAYGQRIGKNKNSQQTQYVVDITGGDLYTQLQARVNGTITETNIYGADGLAWQLDSNNQASFYAFDPTGNTLALTNTIGAITDTYAQDQYGRFANHAGQSQQNFTFLGKYGIQKEEPNFYHVRARNYDATTSRFISHDIFPIDFTNSQSYNRYTQSLNNPYRWIDPTGMYPEDFWESPTAQSLIGFSEGMYTGAKNTVLGLVDEANTYSQFMIKYGPYYGHTAYVIYKGMQIGEGIANIYQNRKQIVTGLKNYYDTFLDRSPRDMGQQIGQGTFAAMELAAGANGIGKLGKVNKISNAARSSTATARSLGVAGERAVGTLGSKTRIPSLTGTAKYRIPDGLSPTTLTEVKNVSRLNYTRQLRDFNLHSQKYDLKFELFTRPNTRLSGPLMDQISNGNIILRTIPH
jgi:RHS repeat-associated protein